MRVAATTWPSAPLREASLPGDDLIEADPGRAFLFTDHLGLTRDPAFTDNVLFLLLEDRR